MNVCEVINRDGQNMQINMPKYAHKYAEEIAKYATKYALLLTIFTAFEVFLMNN